MTEPYLDCTVPVTNIRPFKGCVLVELLTLPDKLGAISLPESIRERASMGILVNETEKYSGQEALIRKLGPEDPKRPFEVGLGDRVIVKFYGGTNMRQPPRRYKLLRADEIQAVFV